MESINKNSKYSKFIDSELNDINNVNNEKPEKQQDYNIKVNQHNLNLSSTKFYDDIRDKIKKSLEEEETLKKLFIKEDCEVAFSYKTFYKYTLYHIIYYFFLGPLFTPFLLFFEGYNCTYNMMFVGLQANHFFQIIIFFATGVNFIIYFFYRKHLSSGVEWELYFCWAALLIRIFCISYRYAYTNNTIIDLRYKIKLDGLIRKREFILNSWYRLSTQIIDLEIMESITRLDIDNDLFIYSILSKMNKCHIYAMSSIDKNYNNFISEDSNVINKGCDINVINEHLETESVDDNTERKRIYELSKKTIYNEYFKNFTYLNDNPEAQFTKMSKANNNLKSINFPGKILLREILMNSDVKINNTLNYVIFALLLIYIISPYIIRFFMQECVLSSKIFGNTNLEIYLLLMNTLVKTFTLNVNVLFMQVEIIDFQRKVYSLECLTIMLKIERENLSPDKQSLPLFNFLSHVTINSWIKLKKLIFDIGLRYLKRSEGYASAFLSIYIIVAITLLASILGLLPSIKFEKAPNFFIYAYFETTIFFLLIFQIFVYGSEINHSFTYHKNLIFRIRNSLYIIKHNFLMFKNMKHYTDKYLEYAKDYYNYISAKIINENQNKEIISEEIQEKIDTNFNEILDNCINTYNCYLEENDNDEKNMAVTLLGIELKKENLTQFYIFIATMGYGILYNYISSISDVI